MKYALANSLSSAVSGLDPNAKAYIDAVVATGATVTSTQRTSINEFVKNGKANNWFSVLRRFYLPIWGAAAPNAIDFITLNSGSFVGGVTHGNGFVQSNGTTGYFDTGVAVNTLSGVGTGSVYMSSLARNDTGVGMRTMGASTSSLEMLKSGTSFVVRIGNITEGQGQLSAISSMSGIISGFRSSGTRYNVRRVTSGRSILASLTNSDFGAIPSSNMFLMAGSLSGSPTQFSQAQFGSFAIGAGMTDTQDSNFTLALKNLWETCTGLTLP